MTNGTNLHRLGVCNNIQDFIIYQD